MNAGVFVCVSVCTRMFATPDMLTLCVCVCVLCEYDQECESETGIFLFANTEFYWLNRMLK